MYPITTNFIAIEQVPFSKVESKVEGGFARIAQKVEVISIPLVMGFRQPFGSSYVTYKPGDKVVLKGDSGLKPWNKSVLEYNGKKFVLCPLSEIIAIEGDIEV